MTPTEQDKELREKINSYLDSVFSQGVRAGKDVATNTYEDFDAWRKKGELDEIMQLITADRKRVALEAGIEAVKQYNRVLTDNLPPKPEYTAIGLDGIVAVYRQVEIGEAVRKANNQCIAELKAQQEEV